MKILNIYLWHALMLLLVSTGKAQDRVKHTKEKTPIISTSLPWSQRMAETIMHDHPDIWLIRKEKGLKWDYNIGLIGSSFIDVWKATNDKKYFSYAKAYADTMINNDGNIKGYKTEDYNLDQINPGKMLFDLYSATGDLRYEIALQTLRQQFNNHPKTKAGGFWHKKVYPHQIWLDGLYMGAPFLARYSEQYHEPENINEVVKWIIVTEEKTRDPKTGLLYHAWDESRAQQWSDKETGRAPHVWGRGMGWYAMALVDVLDVIEESPARQQLLEILQRTVNTILSVQDKKTGLWYQVLDKPKGKGNYLEGSASAMFSYFLLKSINKGYLDKSYLARAKKGYNGMIEHLIQQEENGRVVLTQICSGAGLGGSPYRDGSYEYYINEGIKDNDAKGVGPFIMASLQFEAL